MADFFDKLPPRAALVAIARDFHARGWMPGTAGNLSARTDDEHFWITASGVPKGRLDEGDFLLMRLKDGSVAESVRPGNRPSAEAEIHRAIYRQFPRARACLHGHLVAGVLAARVVQSGRLRLPAVEMIKAFDIWEQTPCVDMPVFENHLDVAPVADEITACFQSAPPPLTALLVRDHGPTVWGDSLDQAYNRFEALDFLFQVLAYQTHEKEHTCVR